MDRVLGLMVLHNVGFWARLYRLCRVRQLKLVFVCKCLTVGSDFSGTYVAEAHCPGPMRSLCIQLCISVLTISKGSKINTLHQS